MKEILLSVRPEETRLAVAENGRLIDFLTERADQQDLTGRIYKGVVKMSFQRSKAFSSISASGRMRSCGRKTARRGRGGIRRKEARCSCRSLKTAPRQKVRWLRERSAFPGDMPLCSRTACISASRGRSGRTKRERSSGASHRKMSGGIGDHRADGSGFRAGRGRGAGYRSACGHVERPSAQVPAGEKPALLFRGSDLSVRAVRDFLSEEIGAVVTDSSETAERLTRLIKEEGLWRPELVRCEKGPIFKITVWKSRLKAFFSGKCRFLPGVPS